MNTIRASLTLLVTLSTSEKNKLDTSNDPATNQNYLNWSIQIYGISRKRHSD